MGLQGRSSVDNAVTHYYDRVQAALDRLGKHRQGNGSSGFAPEGNAPSGFVPEFLLPAPCRRLADFLAASTMASVPLGSHRGVRLALLDLMGNPATRTAKTFAALIVVARAIRHVRETGERLLLLTPSSANGATALRDAVLRAVEHGLVTPDELRIACVVPANSVDKVWSSGLSYDAGLRARNPVIVNEGDGTAVRELARQGAEAFAAEGEHRAGTRVWQAPGLDDHRAADSLRAFYEADFMPLRGGTRWHAHAVAGAFGLLGHHLGTELLERAAPHDTPRPGYLLVQHLRTPDLVLDLHGERRAPVYRLDPASGLYAQHASPHFPARTFDPDESIDPTFCTTHPTTAPLVSSIVREQGGSGIVVSLHECLERYGQARALAGTGGVQLPYDPRHLREWSLVMALTGTLLAIERGLVRADEVVVHGSGSYDSGDFTPLPAPTLHTARNPADLAGILERATG
ncbi:hypothetical protein GCM10010329_52500 [Streptomyces spiroverticillatus]|uniref:Uncharacterized protein n=1 Tax=Streptomyces finlayi TaxID=67296 RepID=A0A919CC21_9ACTN|nr:DUF6002 family protein [Streptomyces finlayi]GHA22640.1 hypothetical protein GCM10010329_52500 [Streptomyces spiroverticillatus]GHD04516.1 hypothetical protein GCM10010334_53440 [Streptomyces finlayi]